MKLKDQVVLITGGGDVGMAAAVRFIREGAKPIIFTHRTRPALQSILDAQTGKTGHIRTYIGDVTNLSDLEQAVKLTVEELGRLDILFTTAGIIKHSPIDSMTEEQWRSVMNVNIDGVFNACKAVVPVMKKQRYGRIIHVSSLGGRTGRPGVGINYAASKAAVIGLTKCLSFELGPDNITVNAIAPGPLHGSMVQNSPPEMVQRLKQGARIFRLGTPEEVAGAAVFLASEDAAWITGEVLDMNGGLYY